MMKLKQPELYSNRSVWWFVGNIYQYAVNPRACCTTSGRIEPSVSPRVHTDRCHAREVRRRQRCEISNIFFVFARQELAGVVRQDDNAE